MQRALLCLALLAGCGHEMTAPTVTPPATDIRVTSDTPSMWALRLDSLTADLTPAYYLGASAPFDTLRLGADSVTAVIGYKIVGGRFSCHDVHHVVPGDVVSLAC